MGRGPVGAPALVKYNDQSISAITEIATSAKDSMVLIKTLTASSDSTLDFVNGSDDVVLDSTYPIYKFVFTSIHPQTDGETTYFQFLDLDRDAQHHVIEKAQNSYDSNQADYKINDAFPRPEITKTKSGVDDSIPF